MALRAIRQKQYRAAIDYFDKAAPFFQENKEFGLLQETTRLLLAVRAEIAVLGNDDDIIVEEVFSDGKEAKFR
ncbi:MAG: hypothetical protein SGI97_05370 [candidate division Zixibacteria bacterium]|nr:hypothetical protein [candidate division Zixibacteria bacterium]